MSLKSIFGCTELCTCICEYFSVLCLDNFAFYPDTHTGMLLFNSLLIAWKFLVNNHAIFDWHLSLVLIFKIQSTNKENICMWKKYQDLSYCVYYKKNIGCTIMKCTRMMVTNILIWNKISSWENSNNFCYWYDIDTNIRLLDG